MLEAINQTFRAIIDVFEVVVSYIGFAHSDNLVVRFRPINHTHSTDGKCANEEVAVRESFFRQHADVHRVTVALYAVNVHALRTEFSHEVAAESLRDETVERRTET